jgi:hypothetical protein
MLVYVGLRTIISSIVQLLRPQRCSSGDRKGAHLPSCLVSLSRLMGLVNRTRYLNVRWNSSSNSFLRSTNLLHVNIKWLRCGGNNNDKMAFEVPLARAGWEAVGVYVQDLLLDQDIPHRLRLRTGCDGVGMAQRACMTRRKIRRQSRRLVGQRGLILISCSCRAYSHTVTLVVVE